MGNSSQRSPFVQVFLYVATAVLVTVLVVIAQNVLLRNFFPVNGRAATDFSPTYLQRRLKVLAAGPPPIAFLGDSVWWGFGLPENQNAISILRSRGCDACTNLAFDSGSPVSDYGFVRLFQAYGVKPKAVFLQINQKVFNPVDTTDQRLHPAIQELVYPLLTTDDRSVLELQPPVKTAADRFQEFFTSVATIYAMRADIRQKLFGVDSAAPEQHLTPADFEETYDLEALDNDNVSVHFLEKTVELLQSEKVPMIAVMTPTNRALVAQFVDTPEYRANLAYLTNILKRHGVKVLNLDDALPPSDFMDNAHLLPQGQRRLATLLAAALPPNSIRQKGTPSP